MNIVIIEMIEISAKNDRLLRRTSSQRHVFLAKNRKNTEGPLRSISKDMLVDERAKLPLRFS
jgi:hypothetical protein